jgi:hypothetical protein
MAEPDDPKTPGLWSRVNVTVRVAFAAVTALIVTAGAAFAIVGNPFAQDPRAAAAMRTSAAIAAYQLQKCRQRHRLGQGVVLETTTFSHDLPATRVFQRCDWPPATSSSADGYTTVKDQITWYPHKSAGDDFDALHQLTAPCERLSASFVVFQMLGRSYRDVVLRPGPLYLVTTVAKRDAPAVGVRELQSIPVGVTLPPPDQDGFFVLLSGHMELVHARCVAA